MDRIIFITPFFGTTGSEVALFNLITRLKDVEVLVISKRLGTLATRLPAHVRYYDYQTFCAANRKTIWFLKLRNRIRGQRTRLFDYFLDSIIGSQKAIFYVNTIIMPDVVEYLCAHQYKFIIHIHEMQHMLHSIKDSDLLTIINMADYIFTSSLTCKHLYNTLGRNQDIMHTYPCVDINSINPGHDETAVRKVLGISPRTFVITMSGTLVENKNPEAFLELGRILKSKNYDIHLLWIGVHKESGYFAFLKKRAEQYKIELNCSWIEKLEGQEYYDYLNISNCFTLTSKEESFSIVLLEALALGKPVFSFASGGPQEIINNDAIGFIIEDHSVLRMAEAIEKLVKSEIIFNPELARLRAYDFSCEKVFDGWYSLLKERFFLN